MSIIVFRVTNAGFYYAEDGLIPAVATNLPFGDLRFKQHTPIYWRVAMLHYDKQQARLQVQVQDMEATVAEFSPDRVMKAPVRRLVFAPLPEAELKAQLSYYKTGSLKTCVQPSAPLADAPSTAPAAAPFVASADDQGQTVTFSVPLLDLTFANGGVTGTTELPGLVDALPFRILNDHIVAEFDHIKPFFVKALKRQTIRVTARLTFPNDTPVLSQAHSPQIARINDEMLTLFRARAVRKLLNPSTLPTVDKSLFTPDDVFASLDDDRLGKAILPHDGQDLLAEILRHKQVRNARQLTFLAGTLQRTDAQLRYVLSPDFGFVFLTSGQEANHFILELLNSHATYIWSIPKEWQTLGEQFRSVEREIAAIGTLGRGQYRRTLHFEHEFWFIVHENAERGLVDGFPRWRNRLLEGLC